MRQQVGVGGKSGPSLQPAKGGAGGRTAARTGLGGRKRWGGRRSRRRADRTDWTSDLGEDLAPVVSATESGARNRGRDGGRGGEDAELSSHLPPPGSSSRPSLGPAPVPRCWPPPPPRLPSGSRRQCAHGRAATGPTAAHSRARRRHRAPAGMRAYSRLGRCPRSFGVVVARPVFRRRRPRCVPISALKPSLPFAGSAFFVSHRNAHSHPRAVLLVCFRSRGRRFPIPEALDWLRSFP